MRTRLFALIGLLILAPAQLAQAVGANHALIIWESHGLKLRGEAFTILLNLPVWVLPNRAVNNTQFGVRSNGGGAIVRRCSLLELLVRTSPSLFGISLARLL